MDIIFKLYSNMSFSLKVLLLAAFAFSAFQTGQGLECLTCFGAMLENCVTLRNEIDPTHCSEYNEDSDLRPTCVSMVLGLPVTDTVSFNIVGRVCGANYKNGTDYECPYLQKAYKDLGFDLLSCQTCDTDSCNDKIVHV